MLPATLVRLPRTAATGRRATAAHAAGTGAPLRLAQNHVTFPGGIYDELHDLI
jgi:hypothetical protein